MIDPADLIRKAKAEGRLTQLRDTPRNWVDVIFEAIRVKDYYGTLTRYLTFDRTGDLVWVDPEGRWRDASPEVRRKFMHMVPFSLIDLTEPAKK